MHESIIGKWSVRRRKYVVEMTRYCGFRTWLVVDRGGDRNRGGV